MMTDELPTVLLTEDETEYRLPLKSFLVNEYRERFRLITVESIEAALDLSSSSEMPSAYVIDLFNYSRRFGDDPNLVVHQLLVQLFHVGASSSRALVAGRLGVLSHFVRTVMERSTSKRKPGFVIFSQYADYFRTYGEAFEYSSYEIEGRKIKRRERNSGWRRGHSSEQILGAFSDAVRRNLEAIRRQAIEQGHAQFFEMLEKPYLFTAESDSASQRKLLETKHREVGDLLRSQLSVEAGE